jgi:AbrB family looped-hinge helix DNA binding protein
MATVITIDASGRLVIPKEVRSRHGLTPGSRLLLTEEDDHLVLIPQTTEATTVEKAGILVISGTLEGGWADHRELRNERFDRIAGKA